MAKALLWLVIVYAGLKFGQVMMGGERGYRQAPVGVRERLGAGEPWLFAVAFSLVVPLAFVSDWYHQRKFSAILERSTDCYARLVVSSRQAAAGDAAQDRAVYERVEGYRGLALDAAAQLGWRRDEAARRLAARIDALARYQTTLPAGETRGCLMSPAEVPNA